MSSVDFKVLDAKLRRVAGLRATVTPQAFQYFVSITPIRNGNARRSTSLNKNVIQARYPYASVLDDGRSFRDGQMRGSKQAPNGMSRPTIVKLKQLVSSYLKSVGK
jgi:hypothetical protein